MNGVLMASANRARKMAGVHACPIMGTLVLIPLALAAPSHAQPRQEDHTRVLTKVAQVALPIDAVL